MILLYYAQLYGAYGACRNSSSNNSELRAYVRLWMSEMLMNDARQTERERDREKERNETESKNKLNERTNLAHLLCTEIV